MGLDLLAAAERLGLAFFVVPALCVDLRLLGVARHRVRVSRLVAIVLPWTASGFAVMAAARVARIVVHVGTHVGVAAGADAAADPGGLLVQPAFLAEVACLAALGVNVLRFHTGIFRSVAAWDVGPVPARARVTGAVSIALFAAIVWTARLAR